MSEQKKRKPRRARGSGGVFRHRAIWWISYIGADGLRQRESAGTTLKGKAETLLLKRTGALIHNLPVVPYAEKLTFNEAARAMIVDYKTNGKRSLVVVERRISLHHAPYFGRMRLGSLITAADVASYTAHRQEQGILDREGQRRADVSACELNRELATLKRIFSLAIQQGRIAMRPHIAMLKESAPRSGFFEREQFESVLRHLPEELRGPVEFAGITGWRIASEILPMEWRQVNFEAGEVTLDAGVTKNGEPRSFPITADLKRVLLARQVERDRLKAMGVISKLVFFRLRAGGRGGQKKPKQITSLRIAWREACRLAGVPGRIPHDLRRSAVRNLDRAGISRSVAMELVGHRTESVYRRYRIVNADAIVAKQRGGWMRRLPPIQWTGVSLRILKLPPVAGVGAADPHRANMLKNLKARAA